MGTKKIIDEDTLEILEIEEDVTDEDAKKAAVRAAFTSCTPNEFYEKYKKYKQAEAEFNAVYEPLKQNLIQLHKTMPGLEHTITLNGLLDGLGLTYVSPNVRTSIDTKRLKEEEPELVKKYTKTTQVEASIRLNSI